ncbi:hypothetical protein PAMP_004466 [Pampus punctatissimus]
MQWELPCSRSSSIVYSTVGVGCHMWLHEHVAAAAAAGRRPALFSAVHRPVPTVLWSCVAAVRGTAMEVFGLRRTQSLKNLSGVQERPAFTRWDKKSVSQLVPQSCMEGRWRRPESRENVALQGSLRSFSLTRSRSMDFLPQREASGTRALCALFESKASLQQSFNSSLLMNSMSATGTKTERDCPLQDWRSHNTPLKHTTIQRAAQLEGGQATNGLPESYERLSRYSHGGDNVAMGMGGGGEPQSHSD